MFQSTLPADLEILTKNIKKERVYFSTFLGRRLLTIACNTIQDAFDADEFLLNSSYQLAADTAIVISRIASDGEAVPFDAFFIKKQK